MFYNCFIAVNKLSSKLRSGTCDGSLRLSWIVKIPNVYANKDLMNSFQDWFIILLIPKSARSSWLDPYKLHQDNYNVSIPTSYIARISLLVWSGNEEALHMHSQGTIMNDTTTTSYSLDNMSWYSHLVNWDLWPILTHNLKRAIYGVLFIIISIQCNFALRVISKSVLI
jgi:hypothetical protein